MNVSQSDSSKGAPIDHLCNKSWSVCRERAPPTQPYPPSPPRLAASSPITLEIHMTCQRTSLCIKHQHSHPCKKCLHHHRGYPYLVSPPPPTKMVLSGEKGYNILMLASPRGWRRGGGLVKLHSVSNSRELRFRCQNAGEFRRGSKGTPDKISTTLPSSQPPNYLPPFIRIPRPLTYPNPPALAVLRVQGRKGGAGRMHAVLDGAGSGPGVRRHGGAVSNVHARLRL